MKTKPNSKNNRNETSDNKEDSSDSSKPDNGTKATGSDSSNAESRKKKSDEMEQETDKQTTELHIAEAKLAEMQDKYIRLSAEFDNYRKRTLREKMDMSKYAEENLLLKIIPIMDDFDRALSHMDTATDCIAMKNGIDLIYGKFREFFKQNGIKEIESMNIDFDVDLHEAVAKVGVDDESKRGKVVDVVLKGYYLQDKVIRFSKVVVGE